MKNENSKQSEIKNKPSRRRIIIPYIVVSLSIITAVVILLFILGQRPDPASERIIRQTAAKLLAKDSDNQKDPNDLTDEDFVKLTEMYLTKKELADIKLLKKFHNLKYLDITSITYPNKELPSWMKFLENNHIIDFNKKFALDISPLEKLTSIERLSLQDCEIYNLEPLRNLKNLEVLLLFKLPVTNIEPLSGLHNIRALSLDELHIYNLEPIKELTKLQNLYLNDTSVSKLEPISKLKNLTVIELRGSPVSDIGPLSGLTNLYLLDLRYTFVANLEPLHGLKNLRELDIRVCQNIPVEQIAELQNALPELEIRR